MQGQSAAISRRAFLKTSAALTFAGVVSASSLPVMRAATSTPDSPIPAPNLSAKAIYVYDATAKVPLYTKAPDERVAIGSVVKVMTALTVRKHITDMNEQVKVIKSDLVDTKVYSNMDLKEGDTLTVGLLLYGLLIPSGNDGALCLARYVGGKIAGVDDPRMATETFIDAMNAYAVELGVDNSKFIRPDGADAKGAYSSAQDVVLLFTKLMQDEYLRQIVSESAYGFQSVGPEARRYEKSTTNNLLGQEGVIGGKTGTEETAGGNVVLARLVNNDANLIIMAVLNANHPVLTGDPKTPDERWTDASTLIATMDEQFTWTPPGNDVMPGIAEEMDVWGVAFQDPPSIPVPQQVPEAPLGYQLQIGESKKKDEPCGKVHLYYGQSEVGSVPIYQAE